MLIRGLLLLVLLPTNALAQAASPAGVRAVAALGPRGHSQRTMQLSVAQDTVPPRPSAAPYVLIGAVTGALIRFLIYQNGVEATQDGDFAFPFSLILPLSAGAIAGAYVGWILRPM